MKHRIQILGLVMVLATPLYAADQKPNRSSVAGRPPKSFSPYDLDRDGKLSQAERKAMFKAHAELAKVATPPRPVVPPKKSADIKDRRQERINRALR